MIERNKLIKVYCYANLVFFALQMIVLGLTISQILDKVSILTDTRTEPSPLFVNNTYFCAGWASCFAFQGLFVMRAFYCRRISTHYRNCLTLKIRFNFVITCSLFIYILILVSVTTISKSIWGYTGIAFIFLLLKRKSNLCLYSLSKRALSSLQQSEVQRRWSRKSYLHGICYNSCNFSVNECMVFLLTYTSSIPGLLRSMSLHPKFLKPISIEFLFRRPNLVFRCLLLWTSFGANKNFSCCPFHGSYNKLGLLQRHSVCFSIDKQFQRDALLKLLNGQRQICCALGIGL